MYSYVNTVVNVRTSCTTYKYICIVHIVLSSLGSVIKVFNKKPNIKKNINSSSAAGGCAPQTPAS